MTKRFALTFDIDWAPDYAILECLALLGRAGCKATFFATHRTPVNGEILARGHDLGIHPNFLPGSSHGQGVAQVISNCLSYAPDAWCVRTHGLVQSTPLLEEMFGTFPHLKLDVSLFMHHSPFAHIVKGEYGGVSFDRLLYNWEDDAEFALFTEQEIPQLFYGELTVFNFHPIHVFLNSSDGREYRHLKHNYRNVPLNSIDIVDAREYKNTGWGTKTYLTSILDSRYKCVGIGDI